MDKKLMIVDDDPSVLITIRELFETKGYEVYTVQNGKECIDELKNGFKGVILLDLMMPIMDGWETLREIKRLNLLSGNIITILTAKNDPGQNYTEFKKDIKDYISKPFDPAQLVSTINNYFT